MFVRSHGPFSTSMIRAITQEMLDTLPRGRPGGDGLRRSPSNSEDTAINRP